MTPKLLALGKVCSVLGIVRDVSWHLPKRGSELEKRSTFSFLDKKFRCTKIMPVSAAAASVSCVGEDGSERPSVRTTETAAPLSSLRLARRLL